MGRRSRAGDRPVTIDVDSTVVEVHDYAKQGAGYGYTRRLGYHPLVATRADTGEVLHTRMRKESGTPPAARNGSSARRLGGSAGPARPAR